MRTLPPTYITLDDCIDYRQIAKTMSNHGMKMNHATARNLHFQAIKTIIKNIGENLNLNLSEKDICEITKNQEFHNFLDDILYEAFGNENKTT
jgi:hypothetical protein